MRTFRISASVLLLAVCVLGCAGTRPAPAGSIHPRVAITTELGAIVVEIRDDRAPITGGNFLRYVDEGRFEGASFYRTVTPVNQPNNEFRIAVIQGGLWQAESERGLPPIWHEPTKMTGLLHEDGTLSMARAEPGSASSEFFICIGDQPELDFGGLRNPDRQGFAAFGSVVEGMDVVRTIHARPEKDQMLENPVRILSIERTP
jgi:peptidyl-prolyl cis-trans isomerase A (cyclophilin A)